MKPMTPDLDAPEYPIEDVAAVAQLILKGLYATDQITPNMRAICRHYLELRAASLTALSPDLTASHPIYMTDTVEGLRKQLDEVDEALGGGYPPSCGNGRLSYIAELRAASLPTAPEPDLDGEIEITALALAYPEADVRAILRGFAMLIQPTSLHGRTKAERLDAAVMVLETLQRFGYYLHGRDGVALDQDQFIAAVTQALELTMASASPEPDPWMTAALLKDRTRRAIRERVHAGETTESLAADYGVPVRFVKHLSQWQMFGDEPTLASPQTPPKDQP